MTVKAILSVKGTEVLTIEPTTNLAAAAKLLAERKIGALVVTGPDQRVVGIVSERDIVQELAAHGPAALDLALTEVMTRKVMTCSASDTISSVMERMTAGKFRHLPVVEQGRLAGLVSIGDVVKYRLHQMEQEQSALRDYIQTA
jgi:CBS domain-containing protein